MGYKCTYKPIRSRVGRYPLYQLVRNKQPSHQRMPIPPFTLLPADKSNLKPVPSRGRTGGWRHILVPKITPPSPLREEGITDSTNPSQNAVQGHVTCL